METPPKRRGLSILIADDQPAFRKLLRRALRDVATEVIECQDGVEAVDAFERNQPDWALLDWMMPKLDGIATARSIRMRHPEARVVLMSVHSAPLLAQEAADAGAFSFFPKERLKDILALFQEPPPSPELTTL